MHMYSEVQKYSEVKFNGIYNLTNEHRIPALVCNIFMIAFPIYKLQEYFLKKYLTAEA